MKHRPAKIASCAAILLAIGACAPTRPAGPSVAVMPAPNKPFEVFQEDQAICKQYADQNVGPDNQANNQQVGSAVVGTLLGAGLGAAIGGGQGAAIGAGAGALGGTVYGAGPASRSAYSAQQRYDIAYQQCMYARGNQVPGFQQAPGTVTPIPPPPPGPPPRY